jgi:hypothetical protein
VQRVAPPLRFVARRPHHHPAERHAAKTRNRGQRAGRREDRSLTARSTIAFAMLSPMPSHSPMRTYDGRALEYRQFARASASARREERHRSCLSVGSEPSIASSVVPQSTLRALHYARGLGLAVPAFLRVPAGRLSTLVCVGGSLFVTRL